MGFVYFGENLSKEAREVRANEALKKLRGFLDVKEPELVYFLHHTWNNQQRAITYKELREAIIYQGLDPQLILDWQQDYSVFVVRYLKPMWMAAIAEAAKELDAKYPKFFFDPASEGVKEWIETKAASFVTNSSKNQIAAINAVVARASQLQDMTVDGLARAIRPMVGLTIPQANANLNYYNKMIESGLSEKKALERSIKYSALQSRYRGYNIARTELAYAYNKGQHEGVKQAQAQGFMGEVEKVWCTADDERTCNTCGALEGQRVAMDGDFNFKTKLEATNPGIKLTPPAHPSCRCAVLYEEIAPPVF